jgi:hypothetical protein
VPHEVPSDSFPPRRPALRDPKQPSLCALGNTQVVSLELTDLQHCRSCPQAVASCQRNQEILSFDRLDSFGCKYRDGYLQPKSQHSIRLREFK